MLKPNYLAILATLAPPAAGANAGNSPWLPEPDTLSGQISYVYQTADEFFLGNTKAGLPEDLEQHTISNFLEYGLNDSIALEARLGYAVSEFIGTDANGPAPLGDSLDGLTDTNLGIRWRVLDELVGEPLTVTLRTGGIIKGSYDVGALNAVGDGASGAEFSTILGRFFENGLAISGEFGYRTRFQPVPDEFFASFQGSYWLTNDISLGISYQVQESLGGIDIGAPGFTFDQFPALNEDSQVLGGSLSYQVASGFAVTVSYAGVVDGRNTSYSDIAGINFGYSLF